MKKLLITSLVINALLILLALLGPSLLRNYREGIAQKNTQLHRERRLSLFDTLGLSSESIIFLGDEFIESANWRELMQNSQIKNRGIRKETSTNLLSRLKNITQAKPQKIFLMVGYHDLRMGKAPKQILENYQKIIKQIQQSSSKTEIYLHSLTPVFYEQNDEVKNENIIVLNGGLRELAAKEKATFIDLFNPMVGNTETHELKPEYTNDGLHLSAAAYVRWKALIERYLS